MPMGFAGTLIHQASMFNPCSRPVVGSSCQNRMVGFSVTRPSSSKVKLLKGFAILDRQSEGMRFTGRLLALLRMMPSREVRRAP